jgi:hypothetical protein
MDFVIGNTAVRAVFTALSVLLSWRLWRFTIRPRLHPDEPKELPYWIPCTLKPCYRIWQWTNSFTVVGR